MLYRHPPFIIPVLAGGYLIAIYLLLTLVQLYRAKSPVD